MASKADTALPFLLTSGPQDHCVWFVVICFGSHGEQGL